MFYLAECERVIILQMEMAGIQLKLQCSIFNSIHIIHKPLTIYLFGILRVGAFRFCSSVFITLVVLRLFWFDHKPLLQGFFLPSTDEFLQQ